MTYYEPPPRRRPQRRSVLDSPVVAALLAAVVLGLVGVYVLGSGLLGSPSPTTSAVGPSTGPGSTPGQASDAAVEWGCFAAARFRPGS